MYKFLYIEDSEEDAKTCKDSVERMNFMSKKDDIEIIIANTYDNALEELKNDYHGIIVDIKLNNGKNGNDIIREIINKYRIPVAVMTGTPDVEFEGVYPIKIFKKGEVEYQKIIEELININSTGLFKVLGGKGWVETAMQKVFWDNLYPQINIWMKYKLEGKDTEQILLRYAIAHIQELIDNNVTEYVTEETYIKPPINDLLKTGSIVKSKKDEKYAIILSPPCDLAIHNDIMKTDRILICEIDNLEDVCIKKVGNASQGKYSKMIKPLLNNNETDYYHWLPKNKLFAGGVINFRKILTYTPEDLNKEFKKPIIKVQDYFVKNILNRFSAYYARQGQPDFNFDCEAEKVANIIINKKTIAG